MHKPPSIPGHGFEGKSPLRWGWLMRWGEEAQSSSTLKSPQKCLFLLNKEKKKKDLLLRQKKT